MNLLASVAEAPNSPSPSPGSGLELLALVLAIWGWKTTLHTDTEGNCQELSRCGPCLHVT